MEGIVFTGSTKSEQSWAKEFWKGLHDVDDGHLDKSATGRYIICYHAYQCLLLTVVKQVNFVLKLDYRTCLQIIAFFNEISSVHEQEVRLAILQSQVPQCSEKNLPTSSSY